MDPSQPACMSWEVPAPGTDIEAWHPNLCAFCGKRSDTVLDHDHETGLTRGYICRSCNNLEALGQPDGHPRRAAWEAWRSGSNPAAILGQQEPYSGFGWVDGVNMLERYYGGEPTFAELQAAINMLPSSA